MRTTQEIYLAPDTLLRLLEHHKKMISVGCCKKCGHDWPCTASQAATLIRELTEKLIEADKAHSDTMTEFRKQSEETTRLRGELEKIGNE